MVLESIDPHRRPATVQLKTILNHVERHKSFVYQDARWADPQTKQEIEIPIEPRANSRAICSRLRPAAAGI